jgi:hypothetical protein
MSPRLRGGSRPALESVVIRDSRTAPVVEGMRCDFAPETPARENLQAVADRRPIRIPHRRQTTPPPPPPAGFWLVSRVSRATTFGTVARRRCPGSGHHGYRAACGNAAPVAVRFSASVCLRMVPANSLWALMPRVVTAIC